MKLSERTMNRYSNESHRNHLAQHSYNSRRGFLDLSQSSRRNFHRDTHALAASFLSKVKPTNDTERKLTKRVETKLIRAKVVLSTDLPDAGREIALTAINERRANDEGEPIP